MGRVAVILTNKMRREQVCRWVMNAPRNTRVEMKDPRRTLPQNDRFWAMLTDLARQVQWHGLRLSAEDWKLIVLDALKREVRMVPNLDGNGFVNLGRSSSDLSKDEMSAAIEIMFAFGAERGVEFHDGQGGSGANNPRSEAA